MSGHKQSGTTASWDVLAAVVIIFFVVSLIDPWLSYCSDLIMLGFASCLLGFLFIAAYIFSESSKILRGMIWLCEHFSIPSGKFMAFFWALFFIFLGGMSLIQGLGVADMNGFHRSRGFIDAIKTEKVLCGYRKNAI